MDDLTMHWRDEECGTVHLVTAHGVGFRRGRAAYSEAETACGVRVTGTLYSSEDPVDCDQCIAHEGGPALQEAERILARGLLPAPKREAVPV